MMMFMVLKQVHPPCTHAPTRRVGGIQWHMLGFFMGLLCLVLGAWIGLQKWHAQGVGQSLPWEDKKQQALTALSQETIDMIEQGYRQFTEDNGVQAQDKASDLLPYLQYTVQVTDGFLMGQNRCEDDGLACYRLHNGGVLGMEASATFTGNRPEDILLFQYDADGSGTLSRTVTLALTREGHLGVYHQEKPWHGRILTPTTP